MSMKRTIFDAHIQIVCEPGVAPQAIVRAEQVGPDHVLSPGMLVEAQRLIAMRLDPFTRPSPTFPFQGGGPNGGAMPVPKTAVAA